MRENIHMQNYSGTQQSSRCECHSCTQARRGGIFGCGGGIGTHLAPPPEPRFDEATPIGELLNGPNVTESAKMRVKIACELIESATGSVVSAINLIDKAQQGTKAADSGAHS